MRRIRIFDTTLRDGEQTPGVNLNIQEKVDIAKQLARLGVDVIEPGFPLTSPGDFEAVQRIAREVEGPYICGFSRAIIRDIDETWKAIKDAQKKCFHIFISSSDIQIKHQLGKTEKDVLEIVKSTVYHAKQYTDEVEYSPMDASRTRLEFLYEVIEAAIDNGATVINIPDTVGYATPIEFGELIQKIRKNVRNIDKAIISVHCHNDLGMAVANSIVAAMNGAQQIECTINGVGERAGNAALEEVVTHIAARKDYLGFETGIDLSQLYKTSKIVSRYMGIPIPVNKPIVGKNVFTHESGIHQDGVLKERSTYEVIDPRLVGRDDSVILLGKHSGRHALKVEAEKLGYDLDEERLNKLFNDFKKLTDVKKNVTTADLESLIIESAAKAVEEAYVLEKIRVVSGNIETPSAKVVIKDSKGNLLEAEQTGNGPVDAVFKAINSVIKETENLTLYKYSVSAVTEEMESLGEVSVTLREKEKLYTGIGTHTDIITSSAIAYIDAINKAIAANARAQKN
ncbi:MAG TPA: 2-isopropylmalate synthase [Hungateiclostridium thermocellum]|jgi:2-isopropylmalate synthase|uniref:2-isopropylmalate synthase n=2 Tax=Acetivibrio thermocellus TaxID=1515 RepID=LEU1_ACET2|nr:2-isopropylmalate synthase [Acetivibrio thermocellus]A3DF94.1 RecName: Full=2-isopropylmalate synthase; AltName: Full=Alpha-IPM synthase; AltName: Full=Alpha-isopropylmalate synthase [Acetivibrio thermocellus ATCC 27405]CDG36067.1 2-isopropylmalate synthase [Acetivibrio thermocellus BC1]ABN52623.1 2-isopropylmalate synthase [Acetivibrio thermocellus ATCC 27405]ADU73925.1 2-isopropylmalate synthase [Acetivibrio thermocellus DSM 1313]ALX07863.1 2-isopropylmalate synthase [Acetivibrio thermoce